MSQRRGYFEDYDFDSVLGDVQQWYHIPTLVVMLGFMLWVRVQNWSNFVRGGEVFYNGNDAWYHYRQVSYVVDNFPQTMPFDPFTYFPYGTASGQFGTLFDQLVATAALVVGLGSPSDQTVAMTLLVAPAVFGTLVAIPVYFAGKRLGGRFGGLVSVLILALSTGSFLSRSLVGFSDHHAAEVLFQMLAVLGVMVALSVAEDEMPVWELVVNREWAALRRPFGWAALAGIAMALYVWVWPPGVLFVGIFGIFLLVQLNVDYLGGRSPEHVAFVGAVSLVVAGFLMFVPFSTLETTAVDFTLVQPLLAFTVAASAVFMAWLARKVDDSDVDPRAYPLIVFGTIAAVGLLSALLTPELFGYVVDNTQRFIGLGGGAQAQTVGEAQSMNLGQLLPMLLGNYGLAWVGAFAAVIAIVAGQIRGTERHAEALFVVVWTVVLLLATLTQVRFGYYLVLPIVVLNAYIISLVARYVSSGASLREIETFQILTVLAVLLLIVAPMAVPLTQGSSTAVAAGNQTAPSSGVVGWDDSLDWMKNNTPAPGTYGGADNRMETYGTYPRQDDYDYPEGAYGVMSWWDYGHWITQRSERIPNANPFQQGATDAADFLLAPNEERANEVVQNLSEDDAETRYVVVDWKMVNTYSRLSRGKFFAPTVFNDTTSRSDYYEPVGIQTQRGLTHGYNLKSQRYYESMVNRLWLYHGSAKEPSPVAINYDERPRGDGTSLKVVPPSSSDQEPYRWFRNVDQAQQYVEEDGTAQIGGVGPHPQERVSALEHYRLVHSSNTSALQMGSPFVRGFQQERNALSGGTSALRNATGQDIMQLQQLLFGSNAVTPPWTKVFERVPGATIEGTGPANETVYATATMELNNRNATFQYTQRTRTGSDGQFSMTVPYATTGFDQWGPEDGYTDTAVEAEGAYRINTGEQINGSEVYTHNATADVTEAQVIGEDDSSVTVELERSTVREVQRPDGNETSGNETSGNETASDGSTDGTSDDGGNQTEDSTNETGQPALAEPAADAGAVTP